MSAETLPFVKDPTSRQRELPLWAQFGTQTGEGYLFGVATRNVELLRRNVKDVTSYFPNPRLIHDVMDFMRDRCQGKTRDDRQTPVEVHHLRTTARIALYFLKTPEIDNKDPNITLTLAIALTHDLPEDYGETEKDFRARLIPPHTEEDVGIIFQGAEALSNLDQDRNKLEEAPYMKKLSRRHQEHPELNLRLIKWSDTFDNLVSDIARVRRTLQEIKSNPGAYYDAYLQLVKFLERKAEPRTKDENFQQLPPSLLQTLQGGISFARNLIAHFDEVSLYAVSVPDKTKASQKAS